MEPEIPNGLWLLEVPDGLEFSDFSAFGLVRRPPQPQLFTVSRSFVAFTPQHECVQHLAREEQHHLPVGQRPGVHCLPVSPKGVEYVGGVDALRSGAAPLHVNSRLGHQSRFDGLVPIYG